MTVTPYDGSDANWAQEQINLAAQQQNASPASASIPASTPVPQVQVLWAGIPDTSAELPAPGGSSSGGPSTKPAPPSQPDFTIDIAAVRSGEGALLTALKGAVAQYTTLSAMATSNENTIFGQQTTDSYEAYVGEYQSEQPETTGDSIQDYANQFANGDPKTGSPGMNAQQQYLLSQIATAFSILGSYLDLVNGATTAYAQSDAYSVLPPVNTSKS